jgi:hypothetical protein
MNNHTFKVWMHIEELDEFGDPQDDEPTTPKQYGEFATLPAAQEAVDLVMSGHDYRPRPSAPDKSEAHTPGPWYSMILVASGPEDVDGLREDDGAIMVTQDDGTEDEDYVSDIAYVVGRHVNAPKRTDEEIEANARLIAAAPSLLNMLQRMVDETAGGGRPCLCTLEHARNALAQAKGNPQP